MLRNALVCGAGQVEEHRKAVQEAKAAEEAAAALEGAKPQAPSDDAPYEVRPWRLGTATERMCGTW